VAGRASATPLPERLSDGHTPRMRGLDILARTMSRARQLNPCPWQYHPRSDHHSKVACLGILFDLLVASDLLREHVASKKVAFGINHKMVDHTNNRPKNLDLVLCRPEAGGMPKKRPSKGATFAGQIERVGLELTDEDRRILAGLPEVVRQPVGSVLMAMEAKAAMTEFGKARPRLYDELASSHTVVHGDTDSAIAVGFAMINGSDTFISPTKNPCLAWGAPMVESRHKQPQELRLTTEKVRALPRREAVGKPGFDAIAAVAVHCINDGKTPVRIISDPREGAAPPQDVLHYSTMINRVVGIYNSRFPRA
jgi:hypothetical protein